MNRNVSENGWSLLEKIILVVISFTLVVISASLIYLILLNKPISSTTPTIPTTNNLVIIQPQIIYPTIRPTSTQLELFDKPARKYVPVSVGEIFKNYSPESDSDLTYDDGSNIYKVSFWRPGIYELSDGPALIKVSFVSYVGKTIDDAILMYEETKDSYEVEDVDTYYSWVEDTELQGKYDETGGFFGYSKGGGFRFMGRLIRHRNIIVVIAVHGLGGVGVDKILKPALMNATNLVIRRLP